MIRFNPSLSIDVVAGVNKFLRFQENYCQSTYLMVWLTAWLAPLEGVVRLVKQMVEVMISQPANL